MVSNFFLQHYGIYSDGQIKIADGQKEIADGQKKFADGQKKFADGQKTLPTPLDRPLELYISQHRQFRKRLVRTWEWSQT